MIHGEEYRILRRNTRSNMSLSEGPRKRKKKKTMKKKKKIRVV